MKDIYSNEKYPNNLGIFLTAIFLMTVLSGCDGIRMNSTANQWKVHTNTVPAVAAIQPPIEITMLLSREMLKAMRADIQAAAVDSDAIAKASSLEQVKVRRKRLGKRLARIGEATRRFRLPESATPTQQAVWEALEVRADVLTESLLVIDLCSKKGQVNWKEIHSIARYQSIELKEMDRFCTLIESCLP
jgi:hypothetical protein